MARPRAELGVCGTGTEDFRQVIAYLIRGCAVHVEGDGMGKGKSGKHRERISQGVKRSWELRRARMDTTKGRPAHVDRWLKDGVVVPELVPVIELRAGQAEQIVQDLGGPDQVTAMQRGMIDGWAKAMAAADVEFARLARGEAPGRSDRLATFLNTARANLQALGLHRRAKKVMDVQDYLERTGS